MRDPLPLETDRLLIRRFERSDLPAFVEYRSHPEIARYQSWSDYTLDKAQAFLWEQEMLEWGQVNAWLQVALVGKRDQCLMGDCAIHFTREENTIEIGYTLALAYQRQGFVSEALYALIKKLFEGPCQKIEARTDARNRPSIAVLERLGFKSPTDSVQRAFFKNEWCEELHFELYRNKWRHPGA